MLSIFPPARWLSQQSPNTTTYLQLRASGTKHGLGDMNRMFPIASILGFTILILHVRCDNLVTSSWIPKEQKDFLLRALKNLGNWGVCFLDINPVDSRLRDGITDSQRNPDNSNSTRWTLLSQIVPMT